VSHNSCPKEFFKNQQLINQISILDTSSSKECLNDIDIFERKHIEVSHGKCSLQTMVMSDFDSLLYQPLRVGQPNPIL
jgi:hypothetical protein